MDADRLQKLEEAQLFTDHSLGQLSEEVQVLGRRVAELAALLSRVEARLQSMNDPGDSESSQE